MSERDMQQSIVAGLLARGRGGRRAPRGARTARCAATLAGLAAWCLAVVGGCSGRERRQVAPDDRAQMAAAERVIDSIGAAAYLLAKPGTGAGTVTDAALVSLAYHERLRLGVGSPFRLAEYALHDPRLGAELQRVTAWSLLAKTARGEGHRVDPLTLAGSADRDPQQGLTAKVPATRQHALIDSTVMHARDARTGEETVRLGFALAAAEQIVDRRSSMAAVNAAAVVRDRRLAVEDARRLLRAALTSADDALTLLRQWRVQHRFAVERALLADDMQPDGAQTARSAVALLTELRRSARADTVDARTLVEASRAQAQRSFLPLAAARRLADAAAVRGAPPQAPIVVTAIGLRRRLASDGRIDPSAEEAHRVAMVARQRFATRARTEESLVAEHAVARGTLVAESPASVVVAAEADVAELASAAAVAMRAYGQETVWFAHMGAPSDTDLRARFGLRRVTFDPQVPERWRPYYRQMLVSALSDAQSVLPSATFNGLSVRVGESAKRDSALAMHDPATRTVFLPAGTGAGTIAHELAHDLDWQTARTWLSLRGAYSTDRAARGSPPVATVLPSLARSVRGLTAVQPRPAAGGRAVPSERPAELFARGVDWLTAAALARDGRTNGYLTSVQDAALSGYASVIPPEPGDRGADALLEVLDDMIIVPADMRAWYVDRFGQLAAPGPAAVADLALTSPSGYAAERSLRALGLTAALVGPPSPPTLSRRASLGPPACQLAAREPWRVDLLWAAAESRARGLLRERATRWAPHSFPARWTWEAAATQGGPWDPDAGAEAVRRTRDAILRQVVRDDEARGPAGRTGMAGLVYGGC